MKYRPDDAELLDAIAGLLEEQILGSVPPALQHQVRVAANLTRILQRQQALEPEALMRERSRLSDLLGRDGDVAELRAELDRRIREDDPTLDPSRLWEVLVATARDDLATAKPGHDAWEGE
jgi:hypothetical protein